MREKRQGTWPTVEDWPFISIGRRSLGGEDKKMEKG